MQCVICGQVKQDSELLVFSRNAYTQIVAALKIDDPKVEVTTGQNDPPVHVCRDCLQNVYQYNRE